MTTAELATRLGGVLNGDDRPVTGFATVSREVSSGDAFLAIRGENVDGAAYAPQALSAGASVVVTERPIDGRHILVANLAEALARFARGYRAEMRGPVVGVTGSVGKTTAKEFVAAALSPLGPIMKTTGNRNSEWTSPLAWFEGPPHPAAAVIEMGMRGFGQITHLANAHRPDVGVVTNIGWAHLELVHTREGIARAKGELLEALPEDGVAILPHRDDYLATLRRAAGSRRVITFGEDEGADIRFHIHAREADHLIVEYRVAGEDVRAQIPGIAKTNALAGAIGLAVAQSVGVAAETAAKALRNARIPPLRMDVRDLDGRRIIMDAYNAAPDSMRAALETLREFPAPRYALLGAMRELGSAEEEAHLDLVRDLDRYHMDGVLLYAEPMIVAQEQAGTRYETATLIEEARRWLARIPVGATVLVKGSRAWELERVTTS